MKKVKVCSRVKKFYWEWTDGVLIELTNGLYLFVRGGTKIMHAVECTMTENKKVVFQVFDESSFETFRSPYEYLQVQYGRQHYEKVTAFKVHSWWIPKQKEYHARLQVN